MYATTSPDLNITSRNKGGGGGAQSEECTLFEVSTNLLKTHTSHGHVQTSSEDCF